MKIPFVASRLSWKSGRISPSIILWSDELVWPYQLVNDNSTFGPLNNMWTIDMSRLLGPVFLDIAT
jgi:hypothetical protein